MWGQCSLLLHLRESLSLQLEVALRGLYSGEHYLKRSYGKPSRALGQARFLSSEWLIGPLQPPGTSMIEIGWLLGRGVRGVDPTFRELKSVLGPVNPLP